MLYIVRILLKAATYTNGLMGECTLHSKHITCADKIQSFDKTSGLNNVYDINISTVVKYEHLHNIQKVFI